MTPSVAGKKSKRWKPPKVYVANEGTAQEGLYHLSYCFMVLAAALDSYLQSSDVHEGKWPLLEYMENFICVKPAKRKKRGKK